MSLSDLPDEILNLISIRLNGFDNCSLWMASDSMLRQRLVDNAITDFDINYTIPGRYLWPGNFLKKLQKLSRLSLVVDQDVFHLPIEDVKLFPVPTLKYLKFEFANPYQLFQQSRLISSNHSTGPATSDNINLNDYYPSLEHFQIVTSWIEHYFWSIDFLRFLPTNLKTFSLPQNHFELDSQNLSECLNSVLASLPQNLTSLHIPFDHFSRTKASMGQGMDLSKLPPNLTSLSTNIPLDQQSYRMMPKHMRFLDLGHKIIDFDKLSPYLPTGLEELEIDIEHDELTHEMFSHLLNLKILHLKSRREIKIESLITKCPPKLEKLHCNRAILPDPSSGPNVFFTTHLTSLILYDVVRISIEFISSLPQSLTDLTIHQFMPKPFSCFDRLPRNLKSLDINFEIREKISLLPETLTYLRLLNMISSDNSYFDRLPPKLETFDCRGKIPRSLMKDLSDSLKKLYIISDEVLDGDMLRMLPRGLKEFSIDAPVNITDADIADLPPNLVRLTLFGFIHITDDAIRLLPRSLTHLNVHGNTNFTDECVKHLPRKLTTLSFVTANQITSKSCKDLPRYLKALILPRCDDWDPKMLIASKNELPQYIRNVKLGNPVSTEKWRNNINKRN